MRRGKDRQARKKVNVEYLKATVSLLYNEKQYSITHILFLFSSSRRNKIGID